MPNFCKNEREFDDQFSKYITKITSMNPNDLADIDAMVKTIPRDLPVKINVVEINWGCLILNIITEPCTGSVMMSVVEFNDYFKPFVPNHNGIWNEISLGDK